MDTIGRVLLIGGGLMALIGIIFVLGSRVGLGRLPGDISFERGSFSFFFPLATSIILSILLTIAINVAIRLFGK